MSLHAFAKPGRFYRGNLHTHSTSSDGARSAADVCSFYRDAGYDFLMLSDHFLPQYNFPLTDTRNFRSKDFTTLLGAELHALSTQHGELWHIVAAGLPFDFDPPEASESAQSLARRARNAGAFVGLAHPAWSGMSIDEARTMDMAHAIEIFNYGCWLETDRHDGFYILDALSNEGRRLSGYATDDAHFNIDDQLGGWMMVKADNLEPESLAEAMKAGDYYSSQGPLINNIALDGDEVVVECSPARSIAIVGRGQRNQHTNGSDQTTARLPARQFANDWFRVVIIDDQNRRAWSNPIWL